MKTLGLKGFTTILALIFILLAVPAHAGKFKEVKQMIMGKEYRIENAVKDGKEGCWVYWGKDKVWWEPKPWHTSKLREIGPAYYDTWAQSGLKFPWDDALAEREKYNVDQVVIRGINGINLAFGTPDYTDEWSSPILSPKGKMRTKKALEWSKSLVYHDYKGKYPQKDGVLVHKYAYVMTYPEDVAGMSGIDLQYSGKKDDDIWFYLPSVRKVRRMSAGSRQDFYPGGVSRNEDVYLTKPVHKYKILRTELLADHSAELFDYGKGMAGYDRIIKPGKGQGILDGVGTPCWVVEVTLPEDWYCAKQIRWYDMKTTDQFMEYSYDKNGRKIRILGEQMGIPDEDKPLNCLWQGAPVEDYNTGYKSTIVWEKAHFVNAGVPDETFAEPFLLKEVKRAFWWR